MCGIFGVATTRGVEPSLDNRALARLRDLLAHRGPDGAGLWRRQNIVLAHRRLAVVDLSAAAAQPMTTADGLYALTYNGEIYNDADLRRSLDGGPGPVDWRTRSDTETLLHTLIRWGSGEGDARCIAGALGRIRGMYALAFYDALAHRLTLARDPLGIKPLYYALAHAGGRSELVFASEPQAVAAHPAVGARPDLVGVSTYLSTVRTALADRTLFAGVRAVRPGEVIEFDLGGDAIRSRSCQIRPSQGFAFPRLARLTTSELSTVREVIAESVRAHLRSDVPLCCMLSGGLDSTIIAALGAPRGVPQSSNLRTYCSGSEGDDDFTHARSVAAHLGLEHAEAPVTRGLFAQRWRDMVQRSGSPLSTPNEVAINEVARRMRTRGEVVTLSGEGADELFGGYEHALDDAASFEATLPTGIRTAEAAAARARMVLDRASWIPLRTKPAVFTPAAWRALEADAALVAAVEAEFAGAAEGSPDPLSVHLRFTQRVNLTGLLLRLDSATMLESIEGRTPFADAVVAALADALPMTAKFNPAGGPGPRGKAVLRQAFAADVPPEVLSRPKASFPLPFQGWLDDHTAVLRTSDLVQDLFNPQVIDLVATEPTEHWNLAWPLINLALWWERWG
jgi:asparagine synthase (glutamine-hydrolysing)